jgi:hypothetical protein
VLASASWLLLCRGAYFISTLNPSEGCDKTYTRGVDPSPFLLALGSVVMHAATLIAQLCLHSDLQVATQGFRDGAQLPLPTGPKALRVALNGCAVSRIGLRCSD